MIEIRDLTKNYGEFTAVDRLSLTVARGEIAALKLALLALFAFPGAPMLYYGDEIAMEGGRDPDNRRGMLWEPGRVNREVFAWTKRLIVARKKSAALRRGGMTTLYAENHTVAFARQHQGETAIIALNASREPITLDLRVDTLASNGTRLIEEWSRAEVIVQEGFARGIHLPPRAGALFTSTM